MAIMNKLRSIIYATIGTSFQRRQFAILLGFAVVPVLFAALVAIPLAQRVIQQRTHTQLTAAATLLEVEARAWLDESAYVSIEVAQDEAVRRMLQIYRDNAVPEQTENLRKALQSVLHASPKVDGVAIVVPGGGRVVYPKRAESMIPPLDALGISDFSAVEEPILTTYHAPNGTSLFFAVEPIRDETETVQAVAVSALDLHRVAIDLQYVAQVLDTGQIYLVDAQGYLLTTLSNISAENYAAVAGAEGTRRARIRESGMTEYTDENGVPIIQMYRWLPDVQLGIVLEVDKDVVFHTVRGMLVWSLALVAVMLVLAVIMARIMNRWLSAPLVALTEAAGAFERGNFAFRLSSITNDEFGQVATAFNHMADSIESSYTGLAQQVAEKTAELRETNARLRAEIEERIRIESQLRLSEEKFRVAFCTSLDSVTISRMSDGIYVDVNEGFERITGYTAEEAVGKSSLAINIWHKPEDRYEMVRTLKKHGKIQNYETTFRKKDGTVIDGLLSGTIISIDDMPYIVIQARDITHRKKTEQALRESEIRYRNIFENSPISLWEEDYSPVKDFLQQLDARVSDVADHLRHNPAVVERCVRLVRIIDVNQATLSMFGAATKEQMLAGLHQVFKPETLAPFAEQVIALWENKPVYTSEQEEQTLDGQTIYVQVSVSIAPGFQDTWGKVFVSVLDMTTQTHAQHAIQRRNQELSLLNRVIAASAISMEETFMFDTACRELAQLFDVPRAVVFMFDEAHSVIRVITEYRASGISPMSDIEFPATGNMMVRYLVTNQAPLLVENVENDSRLAEFKQQLRAWDIVSFVLCPFIVDNRVVGAIGIAADEPRHFAAQDINLIWSVSDQVSGVLARIRLTQTHRRLVAAMEQLAESIIILERDGCIVDVNPAFEKITGYTRDEIIGSHIDTLSLSPGSDARLRERWDVVAEGQVWQGRTITKTKSGQIITEEEIISPLRDPQATLVGFVAVRRDVTRELQLEEQYYQAQKMEAIGRLTGGVAHDFNNLLTAINGFAELMQRRLNPDDWEYRMVSNILKSGQRATNLVRQLLVFSRKQTANPQVLNLNFVVNDIQKMLQRVIGEHIEINTDFGEALWNIKADPTQLEQIIVNLAVNARDAMPDGGTLSITTANVEMAPEYIRPDLTMPGGKYVRLSVADTGVGIPDDVRDHVFEPFFSTKETGKGTGLGLTTVYGIIQQHGGFITFDSAPGQGTTFHVYLPATVETNKMTTIADDDTVENLSGSETILVVEDEESVRAMVVDVLRQFGYRVFSATNGMEGLEVAAAHADELDAVLTDMVMPKLNGKLMADKLLADNPSLCVLFMSGYMADIITDNTALQMNGRFIEKPFTPTTLLTFVRRALDQKSS